MTPIAIFSISGLAIVSLMVAKKWGEKRRKRFLILDIISKGDIRIRRFYHLTIHFYSEGREYFLFFLKKQISMHSRNSLNKLLAFLRKKRERYVESMRDSRLLKKSDGISEFFKNMSNIEKGNGEIHDSIGRDSQDDKKEVR